MQICSCTFCLNYTPHQQVKVHTMSNEAIVMWTQSSFLAITHHSLPWTLQFSYPELRALCHSLYSGPLCMLFSLHVNTILSLKGCDFRVQIKNKKMTSYGIILLWFFWASSLCDGVWNKWNNVTLKYQGQFSQIIVTAAMSKKNTTTTNFMEYDMNRTEFSQSILKWEHVNYDWIFSRYVQVISEKELATEQLAPERKILSF